MLTLYGVLALLYGDVRAGAARPALSPPSRSAACLQRLRFLAGAWPFGVVELIWAGIAVWRYMQMRRSGAVCTAPAAMWLSWQYATLASRAP